MNIRDSHDTDIPAITDIYAHHVRHGRASFELDPPDAAEITRRRAAMLAQNYPFLVAEDRGTVGGYAYASAYRPRPAYRFTVENSIYVRGCLHRGGVGTALLHALIARCEQAGFRLMIAVIGDAANAASIGLHRKAGFQLIGTLPATGWKHGRWVDTILMTRPLGPGATRPPGEDVGGITP